MVDQRVGWIHQVVGEVQREGQDVAVAGGIAVSVVA